MGQAVATVGAVEGEPLGDVKARVGVSGGWSRYLGMPRRINPTSL
jgi:hypothetical protein